MPASSAEAAIKSLSRHPSNTTCPNCGTYSKYGFSTICIKYYTFICNNCKSSHQAISHRCKSVTMSSWDMGEVLKLKRYGNDYARKVWLFDAPEFGVGGRPRGENDDIHVYKRFIVDAYEKKLYYREPQDDGDVGNCHGEGAQSLRQQPQQLTGSNRSDSALRINGHMSAQQSNWGNNFSTQRQEPVAFAAVGATAAVDLLDFAVFGDGFANTAPAADAPTMTQPVFDPFNTNMSSAAATNNRTAMTVTTSTNAASNNFGIVPPTSTTAPAVASPNTNMKNGFDPFGVTNLMMTTTTTSSSSSTPSATTTDRTKPIMNTYSGITATSTNNNNNDAMMMNGMVTNNGSINTNTNTGMNGMMTNGMMMMGNNSMNGNNNNRIMTNGGMNVMTMMSGTNSGDGSNGMMMNHNSWGNNGMNSMVMMMNCNSNNNGMNHNNRNGLNVMNMNDNAHYNGMNNIMNGMNMRIMNNQPQQQLGMAMNMNVVQPPMNSNSITNNFGGGAVGGIGMPSSLGVGSANTTIGGGGGRGGGVVGMANNNNKKSDPFAGLGF